MGILMWGGKLAAGWLGPARPTGGRPPANKISARLAARLGFAGSAGQLGEEFGPAPGGMS